MGRKAEERKAAEKAAMDAAIAEAAEQARKEAEAALLAAREICTNKFLLQVPQKDPPRDFRNMAREKSPFEIGEKPTVQVASSHAIIDKALVMDISGGVTNADEYISLFFSDSCAIDPATCGDISEVKIVIVEEDDEENEPPMPQDEDEEGKLDGEEEGGEEEEEQVDEEEEERLRQEEEAAAAEAERLRQEEEELKQKEAEEAERKRKEEAKKKAEEEARLKAEEEERLRAEEEERKRIEAEEAAKAAAAKEPTPEYDSDVELIPVKEEVVSTLIPVKKEDIAAEEAAALEQELERVRERARLAKEDDTMSEYEKDLEWQRQRALQRPPIIITHLKSRAAPIGTQVRMSCSVSGPDIVVRWFKDGNPIEKGHKFNFKVSEGLLSLEINDLDFKDAGEYSCVVKNRNGTMESLASLTVYENLENKPTPPTFISIKGKLINFKVTVAKKIVMFFYTKVSILYVYILYVLCF